MYMTNFIIKIDKKIYLEWSISPVKKLSGYIIKLKPQESVCQWLKSQEWLCNLTIIKWYQLWISIRINKNYKLN